MSFCARATKYRFWKIAGAAFLVHFYAIGQYYHPTQFNYSPFIVNPAFVAYNNQLRAIVHYRNQPINGEIGYQSNFFTFHTPIIGKKSETKAGIGINFSDDRIVGLDLFSTQRLSAAFAYSIKVDKTSNFILGLQAEYSVLRNVSDGITTGSQYVPNVGYVASLENGEKFTQQNVSFFSLKPSLMYLKKDNNGALKYHLGLSVFNLAGTSYSSFTNKIQTPELGFVLNSKVKVFEKNTLSVYPELLYSYLAGTNFITLGASARNELKNDLIKNTYVTGSVWYSALNTIAAGVQLELDNFDIGVSYQTGIDFIPNNSPQNAFEILVCYHKPIIFKNKSKNKRLKKKVERKTTPKVNPSIKPERTQNKTAKLDSSIRSKDSLENELTMKQTKMLAQERQEILKSIETPFEFEKGSTEVSQGYFEKLDSLASYMLTNKSAKLTIVGYTDNSGYPQKNKIISLKRAEYIKTYLVTKGVETDRIYAEGKGQENPLYSNNNPNLMSKNRRVELRLEE